MRRRLWIVPLAGVLVLAVAHFAYWRYLVGRLEGGFADFMAARRSAGWTTQTAGMEEGGWPLAATLRVSGIRLQGGDPDIPGGLAWAADRLELRLDLLGPGVLHLEATGAQRLRLGHLPDIAFAARLMTAELPLPANAAPDTVVATVRDLRARLADAPDRDSVSAGLVQIDATMDPTALKDRPAIGYQIATEAIDLPPVRSWALGNRISSASAEGSLDGPLPPPGPLASRAAAWRDGGGRLRIGHGAVGWGPLGLSGSATLALDARLQPAGDGQIRLVGYAAALDALAAGRVLTPGGATAAKAVLSLLARPPEGGGPSVAEVPLSVQEGILSMGRVPLAHVPDLLWPAP